MSTDVKVRAVREATEGALRRLNPYAQRREEAFDRAVRIVTRDGTAFFFGGAAALLWHNPADHGRRWLLVWTEHYGYHAFPVEDLKYYGIFAPVEFDCLDESTAQIRGDRVSFRAALAAVQFAKEDGLRRAAEGSAPRPLIVGELNPYGSDPEYALWPYPEQASGDRLCRLVMGLTPEEYLKRFDRTNLCEGKWSLPVARTVADSILQGRRGGAIVLCGRRVCDAFRAPFLPSTILAIKQGVGRKFCFEDWEGEGWPLVVLNHPSGLCRAWNDPVVVAAARVALTAAGLGVAPADQVALATRKTEVAT